MKPLPALLDILDPSKPGSSATRAKAIYTLSGFLKHNLPALEALGPEGWNRLRESIQGRFTFNYLEVKTLTDC